MVYHEHGNTIYGSHMVGVPLRQNKSGGGVGFMNGKCRCCGRDLHRDGDICDACRPYWLYGEDDYSEDSTPDSVSGGEIWDDLKVKRTF